MAQWEQHLGIEASLTRLHKRLENVGLNDWRMNLGRLGRRRMRPALVHWKKTLEEPGQSEALDKEKAVSACADLAYDHQEWIDSLLATTFNVTSVQTPGTDPEKTP